MRASEADALGGGPTFDRPQPFAGDDDDGRCGVAGSGGAPFVAGSAYAQPVFTRGVIISDSATPTAATERKKPLCHCPTV